MSSKLLKLIFIVTFYLSDIVNASSSSNPDALFDEFMTDVVHRSWKKGSTTNNNAAFTPVKGGERPWTPPKQRPNVTVNVSSHHNKTAMNNRQHQKVAQEKLDIHHLLAGPLPHDSPAVTTMPLLKQQQQHRKKGARTQHPIENVMTTPTATTAAAAAVVLDMFSPKPKSTGRSMHQASDLYETLEFKQMNMKRASSVANEEALIGSGAAPIQTLDSGSGLAALDGSGIEPQPLAGSEATLDAETTTPIAIETTTEAIYQMITEYVPIHTLIVGSEVAVTETPSTPYSVVYASTTPRSSVRTSTWRVTPRPDVEAFGDMRCSNRPDPVCCHGRDDSEACSLKVQLAGNQTGICYCDEHCLTVSEDFPIPDCCPDFLDTCAAPLKIDVSQLIAVEVKPLSQPAVANVPPAIRTRARPGRKIRPRPHQMLQQQQQKQKAHRKLKHHKKMLHKKHTRLQKVQRAFVIDPKD